MNEPENRTARTANLAYAAVAGQAGCFTLAIVMAALFIGLWLDAHFGTRGPFTIGVLLFSIPLSLFLMVRIALGAVRRITPPSQHGESQRRLTEEDDR